jgi:predicted permease
LEFLIVNVALPISVFVGIQENLTRKLLGSFGMSVLFVAAAFFILYVLSFIANKVFNIRVGRRGIITNTFTNDNVIFIGLPLALAIFGTKAMPFYLVYYLVNTISTWAIGIFFIQNDTTEKNGKSSFNWKKLVPAPVLGFVIGIIWLLIGLPLPEVAGSSLNMVGGLVTPLALLYLGIIIADAGLSSLKIERDTIIALIARFVIDPAVMFMMLKFIQQTPFALSGLGVKVIFLMSGMPALTAMALLVGQAKGDTKFASNVITISTLLFIILVPAYLAIANLI